MTRQLQMNLLLECCKHVLDKAAIQSILTKVNQETGEHKDSFWNDLKQLASAQGGYSAASADAASRRT